MSEIKRNLKITLFFMFFLYHSTYCFSDSIRSETFNDGIIKYYHQGGYRNKSFLTKEFEKIYNILIPNSNKDPFGRSIAFIVGVSNYETISPQLPSVENDIKEMQNFLISKAGFDEVYVVKNEFVSRSIIEKYIKGKLCNELTKDDRLLFYYSGHGDDNSGDTGYMLFSKAKKNEFWGDSVLPINDLEDWSSEIKVNHMLFIIDCCASGLAFTSKNTTWQNEKTVLKTLSGNGSRTIVTAGTADDKTYELRNRLKQGNGIFTKAFLAAYDDIADSTNSFITINEIFSHIEKKMAVYRKSMGISTTPRLWRIQESDYRGTFVFLNFQASKQKLTKDQLEAIGISFVPKTADIENKAFVEQLYGYNIYMSVLGNYYKAIEQKLNGLGIYIAGEVRLQCQREHHKILYFDRSVDGHVKLSQKWSFKTEPLGN